MHLFTRGAIWSAEGFEIKWPKSARCPVRRTHFEKFQDTARALSINMLIIFALCVLQLVFMEWLERNAKQEIQDATRATLQHGCHEEFRWVDFKPVFFLLRTFTNWFLFALKWNCNCFNSNGTVFWYVYLQQRLMALIQLSEYVSLTVNSIPKCQLCLDSRKNVLVCRGW